MVLLHVLPPMVILPPVVVLVEDENLRNLLLEYDFLGAILDVNCNVDDFDDFKFLGFAVFVHSPVRSRSWHWGSWGWRWCSLRRSGNKSQFPSCLRNATRSKSIDKFAALSCWDCFVSVSSFTGG